MIFFSLSRFCFGIYYEIKINEMSSEEQKKESNIVARRRIKKLTGLECKWFELC